MSSKKKLFAIIAAVAMLAGMLAFGMVPAVAGTEGVSAQTVASFTASTNPTNVSLGTIAITGITNYTSSSYTDKIYVELPSHWSFSTTGTTTTAAGVYTAGPDTGSIPVSLIAGGTTGLYEFDVTLPNTGDTASVYITPVANYSGTPSSGAVSVLVWDNVLGTTSITVANVVSGSTTVTALSTPTIGQGSDAKIGMIQIQENVAGAIYGNSSKDVTLTLPAGYSWDTTTGAVSVPVYQGWTVFPTSNVTVVNSTELKISDTVGSSAAGLLQISNLYVNVPSSGALGALNVTLGDAASGTLQIATVGNYGVTATASSSPTIYASYTSGKVGGGQEIGNILIAESLAGSLISGRTITVTLPANEAWDGTDTAVSITAGTNILGTVKVNSSNSSELDIPLSIPSTSSATIKIDGYVNTNGCSTTGPLTVTVGGTAGVSGTVTAANIAAPLVATASGTPNVVLGLQGQAAGDVTLTEGTSTLINVYGVDLVAPLGVTFSATPSASVTSGDLSIKTLSTGTEADGQSYVFIPTKTQSNTASTISVTGISLSLSSGLSLGPVTLTVNNASDVNGTVGSKVTSVAVANAVSATAANGNASFTVGGTVYSVGGVQYAMDVAPFISNGRTFVPVRYLANALGATTAWDGATNTVTITSGSTTVVLTIGSTTETVNGTAQTMDVAPQIVNSRTMLPARWVAEALGFQVGWNPVTQEVLITK